MLVILFGASPRYSSLSVVAGLMNAALAGKRPDPFPDRAFSCPGEPRLHRCIASPRP